MARTTLVARLVRACTAESPRFHKRGYDGKVQGRLDARTSRLNRSGSEAASTMVKVLFLKIFHNRFGPGVDSEFLEDVFYMPVYRPNTNAQRAGNFLGQFTFA